MLNGRSTNKNSESLQSSFQLCSLCNNEVVIWKCKKKKKKKTCRFTIYRQENSLIRSSFLLHDYII